MLVLVKCFCSLFTDSVIEICCFAVLQFGLSCKIPGKKSEFSTLKVFFFFFFLSALGAEPSSRFCLVSLSRHKDASLIFLQVPLNCQRGTDQ